MNFLSVRRFKPHDLCTDLEQQQDNEMTVTDEATLTRRRVCGSTRKRERELPPFRHVRKV
jgi:hypothetical protein